MAKNIEVNSEYVLPSTGYFKITRHEEGKTHTYKLLDKMTPAMTQDKLAEFYESEKQKGNPLPLNSIQTFELLQDAVISGDSDLMNHLQKDLRRGVNTLSRAIYNPLGKDDETIHNYGTSDVYTIIRDIVGRDGFIDSIDNPDALESLLGTKDIKNINKISNAINKTPICFMRVNSKPSQKIERVVRFDASSDWLFLDAFGDLSYEYPAFLVEKIK